mmetsp:Transcript_11549/g.24756  ORF Transcript_11549/g.24756 Transcript_11549/m.24756 type:complete len:749 (-) Transcript_11549:834-3080(-)
MRVYVHYEGEMEFTMAFTCEDNSKSTVKQLATNFREALKPRCSPELSEKDCHALVLCSENGAALPEADLVSACASDGEDLFARSHVDRLTAPNDVQSKKLRSAASTPSSSGACSKSAPSQSAGTDLAALEPYLEAAEEAYKNRSYARAKAIHTELLTVSPRLVQSLRRLGEIELSAGRPEAAVPFLRRAIATEPRHLATRLTLANALCAADEWADAISELEDALRLTADGSKAYKRVNVELGRALFKSGQQSKGGAILMAALKQDMEDPLTLRAYGEACIALGQTSDAMQIYLRLMVKQSSNKEICALLAKTFKLPGAIESLRSQLPFKAESASALAFIATTIKDHSAIDEAIELYKAVVALVPTSASYALNLVHTLEIPLRYAEALAAVRAFCEANAARQVGGVACGAVAALLPSDADIAAACRAHNAAARALSTAAASTTAAASATASAAAAEPPAAPPPLPEGAGGSVDDLAGVLPAGTYDDEALDLLALHYAAVKMLFVVGCLDAAAELVRLVEPARRVKDLHLTRVRNENAYYCCVAMLLRSLPLPLPTLPLLYVAGDSHSLSPGWRTVPFQGQPHLLKPVLVTGLKAWHLREESDFFPKANFKYAMGTIPDGARVVFAFGEIDCRERLLVAVERARYKDLQEGIDVVVGIYVSCLVQLARSRKFSIMVHPVPPVLKETRAIVKLFNATLKQRVLKEPILTYLDFFDKLLTADGEDLEPELSLDGTHMSPAYVDLLAAAFPSQ